MMDTPATSRKRPAFSPLNTEASQPTASTGSISPPRAWPPLPPTNNNEVMLYRKGGRNYERNCHIPRISLPCVFVLNPVPASSYVRAVAAISDVASCMHAHLELRLHVAIFVSRFTFKPAWNAHWCIYMRSLIVFIV